jgi:hypothetical protein
MVSRVLKRHGIPVVPAGGPIWERFPSPIPVSSDLLVELYVDCGLAVKQIELLTGRPGQTLLGMLHRLDVPVRDAGGRSPFMRRWRGSLAAQDKGA